MAKILDQPRYKCAMAAMQTVQSITRAIPILHSGPGCAEKLNGSVGSSGLYSPHIFPCTAISEKEVIFGGDAKLEETIENSIKIIDADMYIVLTGCTPEIVGDNASDVVRKFKDAGKPVIYASTPGFKGNNYKGHDWILKEIFSQYLKPADSVEKGLVNVWTGVPMHDPFWLGNLREIGKLLEELGLKPNIIFGHGNGIKNIDKIPSAEFNLLISPWVGLESVQYLKEEFNTPYFHYPVLPIGAFETSKFLRAVGEYAHVDSKKIEEIITKHEEEYYYYIERYADVFLETCVMSKRFVTVSDAQTSLAITKFLVNDLGLFPSKQYITDDTPEEYREEIEGYFKDLNYGIEAEVGFTSDGNEIHREIEAADFYGYPLILGSNWEKTLAERTNAHYINISYPVVERLIINSSIAGYNGGLKLLEDIYSVALTRFN
jgi:nitrogenase molybdenum-iron protein beta chain